MSGYPLNLVRKITFGKFHFAKKFHSSLFLTKPEKFFDQAEYFEFQNLPSFLSITKLEKSQGKLFCSL